MPINSNINFISFSWRNWDLVYSSNSLFLCGVVVLFQWLAREIPLLQNLIDRANEKGWRREYPFMIFLDCKPCMKVLASCGMYF